MSAKSTAAVDVTKKKVVDLLYEYELDGDDPEDQAAVLVSLGVATVDDDDDSSKKKMPLELITTHLLKCLRPTNPKSKENLKSLAEAIHSKWHCPLPPAPTPLPIGGDGGHHALSADASTPTVTTTTIKKQHQKPPVTHFQLLSNPGLVCDIVAEARALALEAVGKDVVVFVGPTGAGKTSMMRYLLGDQLRITDVVVRDDDGDSEEEDGSFDFASEDGPALTRKVIDVVVGTTSGGMGATTTTSTSTASNDDNDGGMMVARGDGDRSDLRIGHTKTSQTQRPHIHPAPHFASFTNNNANGGGGGGGKKSAVSAASAASTSTLSSSATTPYFVDLAGDIDTSADPAILLRNSLVKVFILLQAASVRLVFMMSVGSLTLNRGASVDATGVLDILNLFTNEDDITSSMLTLISPISQTTRGEHLEELESIPTIDHLRTLRTEILTWLKNANEKGHDNITSRYFSKLKKDLDCTIEYEQKSNKNKKKLSGIKPICYVANPLLPDEVGRVNRFIFDRTPIQNKAHGFTNNADPPSYLPTRATAKNNNTNKQSNNSGASSSPTPIATPTTRHPSPSAFKVSLPDDIRKLLSSACSKLKSKVSDWLEKPEAALVDSADFDEASSAGASLVDLLVVLLDDLEVGSNKNNCLIFADIKKEFTRDIKRSWVASWLALAQSVCTTTKNSRLAVEKTQSCVKQVKHIISFLLEVDERSNRKMNSTPSTIMTTTASSTDASSSLTSSSPHHPSSSSHLTSWIKLNISHTDHTWVLTEVNKLRADLKLRVDDIVVNNQMEPKKVVDEFNTIEAIEEALLELLPPSFAAATTTTLPSEGCTSTTATTTSFSQSEILARRIWAHLDREVFGKLSELCQATSTGAICKPEMMAGLLRRLAEFEDVVAAAGGCGSVLESFIAFVFGSSCHPAADDNDEGLMPSSSFPSTIPKTIDALLHLARQNVIQSVDSLGELCITRTTTTNTAVTTTNHSLVVEGNDTAGQDTPISTPRRMKSHHYDGGNNATDHITLLNSLKTITANKALRDALVSANDDDDDDTAVSALQNKFEEVINAITEFELTISSSVTDDDGVVVGGEGSSLCTLLSQRLTRISSLVKFREQNGVAPPEGLVARRDELLGEVSECVEVILGKFKEAIAARRELVEEARSQAVAVASSSAPPPPSSSASNQHQQQSDNHQHHQNRGAFNWGDEEDDGMDGRTSSSSSLHGGGPASAIRRCISDVSTLSSAIGAPPKASQTLNVMIATIERDARKMALHTARILSRRGSHHHHQNRAMLGVSHVDLASLPVSMSYLTDLTAMLEINVNPSVVAHHHTNNINASAATVHNPVAIETANGDDEIDGGSTTAMLIPPTATSLVTVSKCHSRVSKLLLSTKDTIDDFLSNSVCVELYDNASKSRSAGWVEAFHTGNIITTILAPHFEKAAHIKLTLEDQFRLCLSDINTTVSDFKTQKATSTSRASDDSLMRLMTGELPAMIRCGGNLGQFAAHITRQCDSAISSLCNDATSSSSSSVSDPEQFWETYQQLKRIQEVFHQQVTEALIYTGSSGVYTSSSLGTSHHQNSHVDTTSNSPPSPSSPHHSTTSMSKTLDLIDSAVDQLLIRVKGLQKEFQDLVSNEAGHSYYSYEYKKGMSRAVSKLKGMDAQLKIPCARVLNVHLQQWIDRLALDGRSIADGYNKVSTPTSSSPSALGDITPAHIFESARPFLDDTTSNALARHNDVIAQMMDTAKDGLVESLDDTDQDVDAARHLYNGLRMCYLGGDIESKFPSSDVVVRTHNTALQTTIAINFDTDNISALRAIVVSYANNYDGLTIDFKKTAKSLFKRFFTSVVESISQNISAKAFKEVSVSIQSVDMLVQEVSHVASLKSALSEPLEILESQLSRLRKRAEKREKEHNDSILGECVDASGGGDNDANDIIIINANVETDADKVQRILSTIPNSSLDHVPALLGHIQAIVERLTSQSLQSMDYIVAVDTTVQVRRVREAIVAFLDSTAISNTTTSSLTHSSQFNRHHHPQNQGIYYEDDDEEEDALRARLQEFKRMLQNHRAQNKDAQEDLAECILREMDIVLGMGVPSVRFCTALAAVKVLRKAVDNNNNQIIQNGKNGSSSSSSSVPATSSPTLQRCVVAEDTRVVEFWRGLQRQIKTVIDAVSTGVDLANANLDYVTSVRDGYIALEQHVKSEKRAAMLLCHPPHFKFPNAHSIDSALRDATTQFLTGTHPKGSWDTMEPSTLVKYFIDSNIISTKVSFILSTSSLSSSVPPSSSSSPPSAVRSYATAATASNSNNNINGSNAPSSSSSAAAVIIPPLLTSGEMRKMLDDLAQESDKVWQLDSNGTPLPAALRNFQAPTSRLHAIVTEMVDRRKHVQHVDDKLIEYGQKAEENAFKGIRLLLSELNSNKKKFGGGGGGQLDALLKDIQQMSLALIKIRQWACEAPCIQPRVHVCIKQLLGKVGSSPGGMVNLRKLGAHLEVHDSGIGHFILKEYPEVFTAPSQEWGKRTASISPDMCVKRLDCLPQIDKSQRETLVNLLGLHDLEKEKLIPEMLKKALLGVHVAKRDILQSIYNDVADIKKNTKSPEPFVHLIGHICQMYALFSIRAAVDGGANEQDDNDCLPDPLIPHNIQILTIYRLLNLDQPKDQRSWVSSLKSGVNGLKQLVVGGPNNAAHVDPMSDVSNHLVQVLTGEGKSITLAILAAVFVLLGTDVDIVCYSEYLTSRDKEALVPFFVDMLDFEPDQVRYLTFSQLCALRIQGVGRLAEATLTGGNITSSSSSSSSPAAPPQSASTSTAAAAAAGTSSSSSSTAHHQPKHQKQSNPQNNNTNNNTRCDPQRILLIDEVDVFLSKRFYGATYNAGVTLKGVEEYALIEEIQAKGNTHTYNVLNSPALDAVKMKYNNLHQGLDLTRFNRLLDTIALTLVQATSRYLRSDNFRVCKDTNSILYKVGDQYEGVVYPNETSLLYIDQVNKKEISKSDARKFVGLDVQFGQFSYAEVPASNRYYSRILGVTGTLKTTISSTDKGTMILSPEDIDILKRDYGIKKFTFAPSVFGTSKLNDSGFEYGRDTPILYNEDDWAQRIASLATSASNSGGSSHSNNIAPPQQIPPAIAAALSSSSAAPPPTTSSKKGACIIFVKNAKFIAILKRLRPELKNCNVLSEATPKNLRSGLITAAVFAGAITIATRSFGRGTDFYVPDDQTILTVIQTFFSSTESEHVQIRGRTARQGRDGQYKMVLCSTHMEGKFFPKEVIAASDPPANHPTDGSAGDYDPAPAISASIAGILRTASANSASLAKLLTTKRAAKTALKTEGRMMQQRIAKDLDTQSWAVVRTLQNHTSTLQKKLDCLVQESMNKQTISKPIVYVMLLDVSWSMDEQPWAELCVAYNAFLDELNNQPSSFKSTVTLSVVFFGDVATNYFTAALDRAVELPIHCPGGSTNYQAGFEMAHSIVAHPTYNSHDVRLVFFTDGVPNQSSKHLVAIQHLHGTLGPRLTEFYSIYFSEGDVAPHAIIAIDQLVKNLKVPSQILQPTTMPELKAAMASTVYTSPMYRQ